jgi:hypothetical protein
VYLRCFKSVLGDSRVSVLGVCFTLLKLFDVLFLICFLFFLCDRVDLEHSRKAKSSSSRKSYNSLSNKASGPLPLHILLCSNNSYLVVVISIYFLKFD